MSKLKSLEMAAAVESNQNIAVKRSFMGLCEKVTYTPTGSAVVCKRMYCQPDDGRRIQELVETTPDRLAAKVKQMPKVDPVAIGNLLVETAISKDRRFVAVQLFKYADFTYVPMTQPTFYEGEQAELVSIVL